MNVGRLAAAASCAPAEAFIQKQTASSHPLSGFQCHFPTPHPPLPSWWPRKRSDSRGEPSGVVRKESGQFDAGLSETYITAVVKFFLQTSATADLMIF